MLKSVEISRKQADYKEPKRLYKTSFPKKELCPNWALFLLKKCGALKQIAYYDDSLLCGFTYLLFKENTVCVFFFAVNDKIRNQGYGSKILQFVKQKYSDKTIVLLAEPTDEECDNTEQRISRMNFYEKNGIHRTGNHTVEYGVRFEILSTDPDFSEERYKNFWENMYRKR